MPTKEVSQRHSGPHAVRNLAPAVPLVREQQELHVAGCSRTRRITTRRRPKEAGRASWNCSRELWHKAQKLGTFPRERPTTFGFQSQFVSELIQLVSNAAPAASTCADPGSGNVVRTLEAAPAVVTAAPDATHFLDLALPDVVNPEITGLAIEGPAPACTPQPARGTFNRRSDPSNLRQKKNLRQFPDGGLPSFLARR